MKGSSETTSGASASIANDSARSEVAALDAGATCVAQEYQIPDSLDVHTRAAKQTAAGAAGNLVIFSCSPCVKTITM